MKQSRSGRRRGSGLCMVAGCGRAIPRWQRLCTSCFKRLPFEKRKAIAEAGEAKAPHIVARLCGEAVAWLAAQEGARSAAAAASTARMMGERDG